MDQGKHSEASPGSEPEHGPRKLSEAEIADLRREMREDAEWMGAQLRELYPNK